MCSSASVTAVISCFPVIVAIRSMPRYFSAAKAPTTTMIIKIAAMRNPRDFFGADEESEEDNEEDVDEEYEEDDEYELPVCFQYSVVVPSHI